MRSPEQLRKKMSNSPDAASVIADGHVMIKKRRSDNARNARVLVVGMPGVGKSAITVRFLTKRFIGEYDEFLESKASITLPVDVEMVTFEIIDTYVTEPDYTLKEEHLRWADGLLLIFDLTQLSTFQELPTMHRRAVDSRKCPSIPCVIVGNKLDVEHARQVSKANGERLCSKLGCPYLELSAAEDGIGGGVQEAFITLYKEIRQHRTKASSRTLFNRIFKR